MRRALVVTDESARHPFLASLPPYIRKGAEAVPVRQPWRLSTQDIKDFLIAYTACFVCVSAFIS